MHPLFITCHFVVCIAFLWTCWRALGCGCISSLPNRSHWSCLYAQPRLRHLAHDGCRPSFQSRTTSFVPHPIFLHDYTEGHFLSFDLAFVHLTLLYLDFRSACQVWIIRIEMVEVICLLYYIKPSSLWIHIYISFYTFPWRGAFLFLSAKSYSTCEVYFFYIHSLVSGSCNITIALISFNIGLLLSNHIHLLWTSQ